MLKLKQKTQMLNSSSAAANEFEKISWDYAKTSLVLWADG